MEVNVQFEETRVHKICSIVIDDRFVQSNWNTTNFGFTGSSLRWTSIQIQNTFLNEEQSQDSQTMAQLQHYHSLVADYFVKFLPSDLFVSRFLTHLFYLNNFRKWHFYFVFFQLLTFFLFCRSCYLFMKGNKLRPTPILKWCSENVNENLQLNKCHYWFDTICLYYKTHLFRLRCLILMSINT